MNSLSLIRRLEFLLSIKVGILALLLLLVLAWAVMTCFPPLSDWGVLYSAPSDEILVTTDGNLEATLIMDLKTGTTRWSEQLGEPKSAGVVRARPLPTDGEQQFRCLAAIRVESSGEASYRWIEFDFPTRPTLIMEHFAVGIVADPINRLYWSDLRSSLPEVKMLPLSSLDPSSYLEVIDENEGIVAVVNFDQSTMPPSNQVRVYEINANSPTEILQFTSPSPISTYERSAYWVESKPNAVPQLFHVSLTNGERGPRELELPQSLLRFCEQHPAATMSVLGRFVVVTEPQNVGSRHFVFDLKNEVVLNLPESDWLPVRMDQRRQRMPLVVFREDRERGFQIQAFDEGNQELLWEQPCDINDVRLLIRERDPLIWTNPQYGLSVHKVDLLDGRETALYRPFALPLMGLALLVIGYVLWSLAWIGCAGKQFPLVSAVIVPGVAVAVMIGYLAYWGLIPGPPFGLAFNYCQGIFGGWLICSFAWLLIGKSPIGIRYLPAVACLVVLLLISNYVFSEVKHFSAEALLSTSLPCLAVAIPLAGLRLRGYRWTTPTDVASHKERTITIRDIFVGVTSSAILLACVQPFLSKLFVPYIEMTPFVGTIVLMLLSTAVLMLVQTPRTNGFTGALLCGVVFGLLLIDGIWDSMIGGSGLDGIAFQRLVARIVLTALLTQIAVYLSFRSAGWRLQRTAP